MPWRGLLRSDSSAARRRFERQFLIEMGPGADVVFARMDSLKARPDQFHRRYFVGRDPGGRLGRRESVQVQQSGPPVRALYPHFAGADDPLFDCISDAEPPGRAASGNAGRRINDFS